MPWRIYKEGEGTWARGILAAVIGLTGLFGSISLHDYLSQYDWWANTNFAIPIIGWSVNVRLLPVLVILAVTLVGGVWAYNRPKWTDYLIDTENELKNRVTWPNRREVVNNSIVVIVTVAIFAAVILLADTVFSKLFKALYPKT